jgi:flagellar biogenesis protein FliO
MGSSIAAVVFVFALLGVALVWVRRATGGALAGISLRVVDAVHLGGGRSVTVVRSGERFFLLGTTAHSVSLIAELDAGDVAGSTLPTDRPESVARLPAINAFFRLLKNTR